MIYPNLENTPIKEIIFSISFEGVVNKECFNKFIELEIVKNKFKDINPSFTSSIEITNDGANVFKDNNGFHLKNKNEVLQIRTGSLSYHFLNSYHKYEEILLNLITFWILFQDLSKNTLTILSISVRYINVIEIDDENSASRLIQLYPQQSSDRNILNFQNAVNFSYKDSPEHLINVVSTNPGKDLILLDITVNKIVNFKIANELELKKIFEPLQEIKNKVFFDSITAKALIRYINQK